MSSPSFSNIDKWLFELKEGNLSPRQVEELTTFLNAHPELQVDAETWAGASITKENTIFPNAGVLERKPTAIYYLFGAVSLLALFFTLYTFNFSNSTPLYNSNSLDLFIEEQKTAEEIIVHYEAAQQVAQLVQPSTKIFYVKSETATQSQLSNKYDLSSSKVGGISQFNPSQISTLAEKHNTRAAQKNDVTSEEVSALEMATTSTKSVMNNIANTHATSIENSNSKGLIETQHLLTVVASLTQKEEEQQFLSDVSTGAKRSASRSSMSTLKRSIRSSVRKVQNMMDNPVALRNFRDPNYHTPLATDFTFNPAMTGTQVASKLQSTVRLNEIGTAREQLNTRVAFDTYIYALRGGLGVDLKHTMNNQGIVQNYEVGFSYSPKFTVKKVISIEPGVRFKVGNKSINTSKLTPGLQLEEERGNVNTFVLEENQPTGSSLWYRDASIGLLVNTPWFYIGGSVDNVGRHYNNIYSNTSTEDFEADLYYNAQVGTDYVAQRKDIKLSTYLLYQQRGAFKEAWLGSNLTLSSLHVGAGVSSRLEPAVSLGFDNERLRLIYQGDYTQSFITLNKGFNHQVTLRYKFKPNRYAMRILKK